MNNREKWGTNVILRDVGGRKTLSFMMDTLNCNKDGVIETIQHYCIDPSIQKQFFVEKYTEMGGYGGVSAVFERGFMTGISYLTLDIMSNTQYSTVLVAVDQYEHVLKEINIIKEREGVEDLDIILSHEGHSITPYTNQKAYNINRTIPTYAMSTL